MIMHGLKAGIVDATRRKKHKKKKTGKIKGRTSQFL